MSDFELQKFKGCQRSFTAKECETLFWLVEESGIEEEAKLRLKNKLQGEYVSDETYEFGQRMQKSNRVKRKQVAASVRKRLGIL